MTFPKIQMESSFSRYRYSTSSSSLEPVCILLYTRHIWSHVYAARLQQDDTAVSRLKAPSTCRTQTKPNSHVIFFNKHARAGRRDRGQGALRKPSLRTLLPLAFSNTLPRARLVTLHAIQRPARSSSAAHETNEPTSWIAKSLVVLSSYVVRAFAVDLLGIHHGQFPFRLALKLVVCAGMSLKIGVQQILDVLTETLGHRSHLHTNWAEL